MKDSDDSPAPQVPQTGVPSVPSGFPTVDVQVSPPYNNFFAAGWSPNTPVASGVFPSAPIAYQGYQQPGLYQYQTQQGPANPSYEGASLPPLPSAASTASPLEPGRFLPLPSLRRTSSVASSLASVATASSTTSIPPPRSPVVAPSPALSPPDTAAAPFQYSRVPFTQERIAKLKEHLPAKHRKANVEEAVSEHYGPPDVPAGKDNKFAWYICPKERVFAHKNGDITDRWRFRLQTWGDAVDEPESTFKERMTVIVKAREAVRKVEEEAKKEEEHQELADRLAQGAADAKGKVKELWPKKDLEAVFNYLLDSTEGPKRRKNFKFSKTKLVELLGGRRTERAIEEMWTKYLKMLPQVHAEPHTGNGGGDPERSPEKQRELDNFEGSWMYAQLVEAGIHEQPNLKKLVDFQSSYATDEEPSAGDDSDDEGSDPSGAKRKGKRKAQAKDKDKSVDERQLDLATRETVASEKLSDSLSNYLSAAASEAKNAEINQMIQNFLDDSDPEERAKGRKMRSDWARKLLRD